MKILIVTQYFFPEKFVINEIARDLVSRGHETTVLTGFPNYPAGSIFPGYTGKWLKREQIDGIHVLRVPLIPRRRGRALNLMVNYLSFALSATLAVPFLRKNDFDVILVFEPSPITVGIPAIIAKWLKRAPIVFWVQDLWPESLIATRAIKNELALGLVRRLVRFIYRHSDLILVQSKGFIEQVRRLAPSDKRIEYLPNPADSFYVPNSADNVADENAVLRPGFRIIFGGNFGVAQDLYTVIGAAERTKHLPDIKWILIGDGRMRPEIEAEIVRRGLDDTIQVIGPYPPERMPAFYAQSDALLVTLRRDEAFAITIPSKVQAYLASARPILAAVDGETARIIEEARAGICSPAGEPQALANAAIRLFEMSPAERKAMGVAGREYFDREFSRKHVIERLETSLQQVQEREQAQCAF